MATMAGQTLPNGYMVIEVHEADYVWIVLAMKPSAKTNDPGRYATWLMQEGKPDTTEVGHYFADLYLAVEDYMARAGLYHTEEWRSGPVR